jgi:cytochrome c553
MTSTIPFLAALLVSLLISGNAMAQQKDAPAPQKAQPAAAEHPPEHLKNNVALCIGCHGIPGYKTAFPVVYHVPMIAGQQPAYIVNALKAYKSGERSHPSMRGIAASLSEEDMAALAGYYGQPAK